MIVENLLARTSAGGAGGGAEGLQGGCEGFKNAGPEGEEVELAFACGRR